MTERITLWVAPEASIASGIPDEGRLVRAAARGAIGSSLAEAARDEGFVAMVWGPGEVEITPWAFARCLASVSGCAMVYGDYEGPSGPMATLESEPGSLREEFDAGPMWFARSEAVRAALGELPAEVGSPDAIRYGVRLGLLRRGAVRLPECIARVGHLRREDMFGYVRAEARSVQDECECAVTDHLRRIGAWLPPRVGRFVDEAAYPVEASIVIPVRNRVRTIRDAVASALAQRAPFPFGVIVVDNHSTDGTSAVLGTIADPRLTVLTPTRRDLGIGGCWNAAAACPLAGRYLVQLDSDDVYASDGSLATMVRLVASGPWAMAVGAYRTVDTAGAEVAPGVVAHPEWTDLNGHNNLLRVSGVGAPRVFATALVRANPFPNVSYGEDYAMALRLSREYCIARTHEPLYLARRWEGNTDHATAPPLAREREAYKNRLRTIEVTARAQGGCPWPGGMVTS